MTCLSFRPRACGCGLVRRASLSRACAAFFRSIRVVTGSLATGASVASCPLAALATSVVSVRPRYSGAAGSFLLPGPVLFLSAGSAFRASAVSGTGCSTPRCTPPLVLRGPVSSGGPSRRVWIRSWFPNRRCGMRRVVFASCGFLVVPPRWRATFFPDKVEPRLRHARSIAVAGEKRRRGIGRCDPSGPWPQRSCSLLCPAPC
ncbi:hypothetical protein TRVL_04364 [Trypanosoma vivax]|nr:hypothetical protein TRVL_04364 [Trypanosoma vivax]